MGAGIIGYCDIDPWVPLFSLLDEIRDVLRYMRSRLHEKWYDHYVVCPLPDTCFQYFRKRRPDILQERMFNAHEVAYPLDLGHDSLDRFVRAPASAPVSQNYYGCLHSSSSRRARLTFLSQAVEKVNLILTGKRAGDKNITFKINDIMKIMA